MNNQSIEKMVHHIRGTFPSQQISFNAVIEVWQGDAYLQSVTPDAAYKAMPMIEDFGKFPSLPQMRDMIRKANNKDIAEKKCPECDGNGWLTGIDLMLVDAHAHPSLQYKQEQGAYTQTFRNHEYSYAKRCKCSPM
jgi:hypothetical protein